ncbi:TPA: hypothetical protein N2N50_000525 [Kluyvera ascorbata]|nr:hypothetical protein STW0522KLE44_21100 [Klebsiella sp. STW0522-44]HAT7514043.1 hypothetical protein [Kluyvera ascorbata]HCL5619569.1 hypothetical protein [Kluyvera ascorbata]HED3201552.1 hypothetical protein [Kluyvera ascorbata]HED4085404.1 hypothetical protein [Kluyvera ascorbata]
MSNTTGKGCFTKGHTLSKGKGRPRKHPVISALENLDSSLSIISDRLLNAIAKRDTDILREIGLPLSQVSRKIELTVKGLLSERYSNENH